MEALESLGVPPEEIKQIRAMHAAADARDFSAEHPGVTFSKLDQLASRVAKKIGTITLSVFCAGLLLSPGARADEWSEARQIFERAQATPTGSQAANMLYQESALRFQAAAGSKNRPGEAWYNAGNAWFQAGAIGRAIGAYQMARQHRPFDSKITDNLTAARALTLNDVPASRAWWRKLPDYWLKPLLLIVNFLFWGALLLSIRYHKKALILGTIACGSCLFVLTGLLLANTFFMHPAGVVVVDSVFAKKGPGHAYANAFNEPLHDGLELTVIENRGDWALIELPDSRQCWIPRSQLQDIH
jgi:tetratricopeptide (TPR) repeat protein